jgi:hypothetical protein
MRRSTALLAAFIASAGLIAVASPAEAATSADKRFRTAMTSTRNPDYDVYRGSSTKILHRMGVSVCGLVKAYDKTEPAEDAVIDSLLYMEDSAEYPYTKEGQAYLLVASIHSYCTKYNKTLAAM